MKLYERVIDDIVTKLEVAEEVWQGKKMIGYLTEGVCLRFIGATYTNTGIDVLFKILSGQFEGRFVSRPVFPVGSGKYVIEDMYGLYDCTPPTFRFANSKQIDQLLDS